jgi:hypothetical protein
MGLGKFQNNNYRSGSKWIPRHGVTEKTSAMPVNPPGGMFGCGPLQLRYDLSGD